MIDDAIKLDKEQPSYLTLCVLLTRICQEKPANALEIIEEAISSRRIELAPAGRVIVGVSGGVVNEVYSDANVSVLVFDHDDAGDDDQYDPEPSAADPWSDYVEDMWKHAVRTR